jgi:DNA-binding CsgD family transcriptional regulator
MPRHRDGAGRRLARLVAEGLTNKEVADQLFVSPHTVSSHLRHVFSKLGITNERLRVHAERRGDQRPRARMLPRNRLTAPQPGAAEDM